MKSLMRQLARNPLAVIGALFIVLFSLGAALAPYLSPHDPFAVNPRLMLQTPSTDFLLGTDDIGRDVFSRLLHAGRASLTLGMGVAVVAVGLGMVLGAAAGFFRGWVDRVVSAAIDTMLSVPMLALAMVAGAFVELTPGRLVLILSAIAWTTVARLVRGQVLTLKEWPYVEAALAAGASPLRILFRHIVPNTMGAVLVAGTLLVAHAILIESALSFLGFGVPPPTATWGGMLHAAQLYYREAPWLAVFPGLAITIVVASINFVGEGLRQILDPRQRSL